MKMGLKKRFVLFEMPASKIEVEEPPYTYARVMAMRKWLFRKPDYERMLKLALPELVHLLQEAGYKNEVEKLAPRHHGTELVERSVFLNLVNTYMKLRRISGSELCAVMDFYMRRKETELLKRILRAKKEGKFQKVADEIEFLPFKISKKVLERDIENIAKTILPDGDAARDAVEYLKKENSLSLIETLMDLGHYKELLGFCTSVRDSCPGFCTYVMKEIESVNIMAVLRLRNLGVSEETIRDNIVPVKGGSTEEILKKDANGLIGDVKRLYPEMREFADTDIQSVESEISRAVMRSALKLMKSPPLSSDLVIGYLLAKEVEAHNLAVIAKSKELGLKEENIYNMLVIRD